MPEHVYPLVTEPSAVPLAKVLMALKISSAKQLPESPFWQARYYDCNVFPQHKQTEKLKYIHRNPVRRGLVERPEDWEWSSFRHYLTGEPGIVPIESFRAAFQRDEEWRKARAIKNQKEL
jgi:putative transposase